MLCMLLGNTIISVRIPNTEHTRLGNALVTPIHQMLILSLLAHNLLKNSAILSYPWESRQSFASSLIFHANDRSRCFWVVLFGLLFASCSIFLLSCVSASVCSSLPLTSVSRDTLHLPMNNLTWRLGLLPESGDLDHPLRPYQDCDLYLGQVPCSRRGAFVSCWSKAEAVGVLRDILILLA
jgi:hypothetical protein